MALRSSFDQDNRMRLLLPTLLLAAATANAQPARTLAPADTLVPRDAQVIPLWPKGAPGAVGDSSIDKPSLTVFRAPAGKATGAAAVVFPGGGYAHLAVGKEGVAVAHWLNSIGVTAFVATYRLGPRYHYPAMIDDGLRAVRIVRARASEWGVDPRKIGVVVNRVERKLFRLISLDDVAKTLKLPILGSVHLDAQLLASAHDQGLLARQVQKKSQFMSDIAALAQSVGGEFQAGGSK